MVVRQYWMGGFGPFTYNDADLFSDASPHRFATDRPPIANDDVVRLQDINALMQLVVAASIDNPAAEMAGMDSDVDGGLLVVYQATAGADDEYTIYAWDSNAAGVADVPYVVAGAGGGYWIAVAGKYHNGEANFGDATNNFALAADGTVSLNGTAQVINHIRVGAASWKGGVAAPTPGFIGIYPTLAFDRLHDDSAHFSIITPLRFAAGSEIQVIVDWAYEGAPDAGSVAWGLEYKSVAPGEAIVGGTTTTLQVSSINNTSGQLVRTVFATGITGSVAHEDLGLRIYRDISDVGDTLITDASIVQTHFMYVTDKLGG